MSISVEFDSTDGNGVDHYTVTSDNNGPGTTALRVLEPDAASGNQPHRFVYLLPVHPDDDFSAGDPVDVARTAGLHNTFNATLVAPQFHTMPWLGDHPSDADLQYETFMASDLRPWVAANLAGGGEHWLVSFSKGGFSALGLILRNPSVFHRCAAWDTPHAVSVYNGGAWQFDADDIYVTEAGILAYDPPTIADSLSTPFETARRIWLAGDDSDWEVDVEDIHDAFVSAGILHAYKTGATRAHTWDSGWLPEAFAGLAPLATVLDMPSDGVDGSTTFTDESAAAHTITVVGGVEIDTAQSHTGGASALFATGRLVLDGSGDFSFFAGDFDLILRVRRTAWTGVCVLADFEPTHGAGGGPLIFSNDATLVFHADNASRITTGDVFSANTWHEVTVRRVDNVTRLYVDDVQQGGDYADINSYVAGANCPVFGQHADGSGDFQFAGWMDAITITKGTGELLPLGGVPSRYLPRGGAALNEEQREYWRRMREEAEGPAFEPPPQREAPPPPKSSRKAKPRPSLEAPRREALDGRVLESVKKTVAKLEERKRRELEDDDEDVLLMIA